MSRSSRTPGERGGVCYVVSQYPTISHTFILDEVDAVRRSGLAVKTVTIRRTSEDQLLTAADRDAAATSTSILPLTPTKVVRALLLPLLRSPAAFAATFRSTLATTTPGWRARLWRTFYFVEGMVLWQLCAAAGIRSIHAHFANAGADLARVAAAYGNRVDGEGSWSWSFTMHGCTEFYDISHFGLPDKIRSADLVRGVSDYTRTQLLRIATPEHWGKIVTVRCGVDVDRFTPVRSVGSDRLRILFVGRMVVEKGIPVLIEALAQLRDRGVAFEATLVGEGELRTAAEAQVRSLGLADQVRFEGALGHDEVVSRYHHADVLCLTSFGEGLPIVLMEALACEVAVVAPWLSGIPELVQDGVTGCLVVPGRPELLAGALARLAEDPELRARLGRAGRQRVLELHDVRTTGHRMAEVLGEVRRGA